MADSTVQSAAAGFADKFGRPPRWIARAPGRVNLIGEHTDYNGGFVLPMAIDRHAVIAAAPAESAGAVRLRITSLALDATVDIPLADTLAPGEPSWANYVRGVVSGFQQRGITIPSVDAAIATNVPLGGGLSSSAALEVATATLLEAVTGTRLDPVEKARLCRWAENDYAGVPCGLMDQLAAVLGDEGGALLIDCRAEVAKPIAFADESVAVLVCNTNVRHALADGAYARRRRECDEAARILDVPSLRDATVEMLTKSREKLGPVRYSRAHHVVTENARTVAAAEVLGAGDFGAAGKLMYESHASLRNDFEVSCPELDAVVELASEVGSSGGVFGARMTGGGFGGCAVVLVQSAQLEAITQRLAVGYQERTGLALTTFRARPARGAELLVDDSSAGEGRA